MRAWILSDIHHSRLDALRGRFLAIPDADVCICAGDVSDNMGVSIAYVLEQIEPRMPVVLVFGNHDYYHFSIPMALERARLKVEGTRVHLLENQSVEIAGRRYLGATLWTNFAASMGNDEGNGEHGPLAQRRSKAFAQAPWQMHDLSSIYRSDQRPDDGNVMVTCSEILGRHIESSRFIDKELSKFHDGPTIVVTHHAPLVESFDPRFYDQATNAACSSDLSDLIRQRKPSAWVHGHTHRARDYMIDKTRIICNPVGYFHEGNTSGYRPGLLIDL